MISAGFDRAELIIREDGYWLAVKPQLEDLPILRRWLYQGVKGRQRLSIAPWKKRRSLDANGYAWALMDKLAQAMNLSKEDVYREEIRKTAGVSQLLAIREEAVDQFRQCWEKGHLGQFCEDLGPHTVKGYRTLLCYYGSSGYDTAQMSRLIDNIVQDCKALGIETASERELSLLLEDWDHAQKNQSP